jgi:tRNA A-37 threonylcarbamoyl transferase component Bud32/tetratricopeptide (TPR) repeat protein
MSEPTEPTGAVPALRELTGRIGKYEIVRLIGKGAMGMVYLAHDTVLDRDVALKVMAAQIADDAELKGRFEREARAVAKMAHPNIVTIFDLGSHTDGSPYIAMELLRGQDLQRIARRGDLPVERKLMIILQVLSGLAHAHEAGIVHRDIKPANIFIGTDNSVKIMDFGVARLTTASMTGTGNIVGTADYMSPEQVKGQKVDGRSDLFSVGCMMYELIAGKRPFHADNLMAIFYRITHQEADFSALPSDPQTQALVPILRKAIAKDVGARYQTAREFAADLRELLRTLSPSDAAVLAEMEGEVAPTLAPQPSGPTQRGGQPLADATVEIGPTVVTPSDVGPRPATAPHGTARRAAPAVRLARPVPAAAARRSPVGIAVVIGTLIVVGGVGAAWWFVLRPAPATGVAAPTPGASIAVVGVTPEAEPITVSTASPGVPTLPTPIPTVAPQPTFAQPEGKAAEKVRSAQVAFRRSDYERAAADAQQALREDPANAQARQLLDNSFAGQKAVGRFRASQAALGRGDLDQAAREVAEGRELAPWDARGPELLKQIEQAQQQAAQAARRQGEAEQAARAAVLLDKADDAMRARNFEQAIRLYDDVLRQDPRNARAGQGKTGAIAAQAMAQSASTSSSQRVAGSVKGFQAGKTAAQAGDGSVRNAPEGFEAGGEVVARRGAQAADLPGKILFDIAPPVVRAGDRYTVSVSLLNEGNAPIEVAAMQVTTIINGGKSGGSVPSLTKLVGPRRKELIFSVGEIWREDFATWAMEVSIRTPRGETYRNRVEWR